MQETWVTSLVGKIPWRRKWQPTPVFLPGKSHGQRSLAGYSPWGKRVGCDWVTSTVFPLRVYTSMHVYSYVYRRWRKEATPIAEGQTEIRCQETRA